MAFSSSVSLCSNNLLPWRTLEESPVKTMSLFLFDAFLYCAGVGCYLDAPFSGAGSGCYSDAPLVAQAFSIFCFLLFSVVQGWVAIRVLFFTLKPGKVEVHVRASK